ncbi:MAG: DUF4326 domain-containing protein [Candidatus Sulfotelmatobacter sp.]
MTTVVNRRRTHAYGVYIGRAYSMIPESPYHNPYHLGADGDRDEVILKFAVYWYAEEQRALRERSRRELPFRVLGCWCAPEKCHGDIIAGYVDWREIMESPTRLIDG